MPQGDRTGPLGEGPLTGRGFGPCGRGLRRGLGRGYRRFGFRAAGFEPELSKEQEAKILEAEKAEMEAEIETIKKKLSELKK